MFRSGFYQDTRLAGVAFGPKGNTRNWSGRDMQLCYSLKSVESSPKREWEVRHKHWTMTDFMEVSSYLLQIHWTLASQLRRGLDL